MALCTPLPSNACIDLIQLYAVKYIWNIIKEKYDELIVDIAEKDLEEIQKYIYGLVFFNAIRPAIVMLLAYVIWIDIRCRELEQYFEENSNYFGE